MILARIQPPRHYVSKCVHPRHFLSLPAPATQATKLTTVAATPAKSWYMYNCINNKILASQPGIFYCK